MKILLLGKNGQVGWELQRSLQVLGEVVALDRSMNTSDLCGDIANFDAIEHIMNKIKPDIVVNATAYTAVDKAESEQQQATLINNLAVRNLANHCVKHNCLLIHYSTDYVFKGDGVEAWKENDETGPLNFYGLSKRQGEIALEQSGVNFLNFRTSWVYAASGQNFIKTMLRLAESRAELNIIADQIGAPTGAALIADITAQVIKFYDLQKVEDRKNLHGHYHLVASGETTWYDYAQFIFEQARLRGKILAIEHVQAITTSEYLTPATRPLNSRLNTTKLQQTFDVYLPNWRVGVEQVLTEII